MSRAETGLQERCWGKLRGDRMGVPRPLSRFAMVIDAYIRVVGSQDTILAIHKETNAANARVKPLKAPRGETGEDRWWDWGTEPTRLDPEKPDDGINAILRTYRPIFPAISKHAADADIYLEIVVRYSGDDEPRDVCFSAETIQLISELGAAVDIDVVPLAGDRV